MTVVGALGLGAMGRPIAAHVARAGFEVHGFDTDPAAILALLDLGGRACTSLAELGAASDVCLVCLPTDHDVRHACLPPAGLLGHLGPESILVICSSVRPEICHELAAASTGAAVIDAALTGGVRGAEAGTVNLLVGGDEAALRRARPVFDAFCTGVHHLGALGSGQIGKTVNNMIHWAEIAAIVEALSLGARLGVPPDRMRPALVAGPTDSRTLRELELMRLTWYVKDIDNAQRMAERVGAPLPLTGLVRRVMDDITVEAIHELLTNGRPAELRRATPEG
ncbi:MAG TPA: NAD(P)-dependent oxidoreductase [Actinomycetes bacterium]|jgi:3-hydroxyisobutyrate dehydrogenase|nr:NAD(P)-dependent oxidoreductase [Actinomycetes bacterium]